MLYAAAMAAPNKAAIVSGPRRVTYRELAGLAAIVSERLLASKVCRGDRVAVCGTNSVEVCAAFFAILDVGAIAVVIDPASTSDRVATILADCTPTVSLLGDGGAALNATTHESRRGHTTIPIDMPLDTACRTVARSPAPEACDDDLAAIIYTSGSTGAPKGVMLTHRNMNAAKDSICTYLQMQSSDVVLCALPLAFDYGLYQLVLSVHHQATLVLERSFHMPWQFCKLIEQERVTILPVIPTMLSVLDRLNNGRLGNLSTVRTITSTAATLSVNHIEIARRLFVNAEVFSMYGLTECKRCTFVPPSELDRKRGSVGIPIPHTEMWAVDPGGNRVDDFEIGELIVRGATVMTGYWGRPVETAAVLRPGPTPGELVLLTGDLGYLDDEGYVYLTGRIDDVVKVRGHKVAPAEIESVAQSIDGVADAAVLVESDELLGHSLRLVIVPTAAAAPNIVQLISLCRSELTGRLESYKVPATIESRPSLPRTSHGKLRRSDIG